MEPAHSDGGIQFDLRAIVALTIVVAAIFAIGRQLFDAGAVLAAVLAPAVLIFAIGTLKTKKRALLGLVAVIVPLGSFVVGVFIQCLVWGVVYRLTWIIVAVSSLTAVATVASIWFCNTKKQFLVVCALLGVVTTGFTSFRFAVTSSERWAARKFSIVGNRKAGWVRYQPLFTLPTAYGKDLRKSEGIDLQWLTSARLLFGLSESAYLTIQEPLSVEEWKQIGDLKGLRYLTIHGLSANELAFDQIGRLENLEQLSLSTCEVDGNLEELRDLKKLTSFSLSQGALKSSTGLGEIKSLVGVGLYSTSISNPSLLVEQMMQLPNLESLEAASLEIGTEDFQRLMEKKKSLNNAGTGKWLANFSANVDAVAIEVIVGWLEDYRFSQWKLGRLRLSGAKLKKVQAELDARQGFLKEDEPSQL